MAPPSLSLYGGLTWLLSPVADQILAARARAGKEDPARLGERRGRAGHPRPPGKLAWLHAVSVGESVSLLPLIEALCRDRPDLNLLVTSGTRTSADLLAERLPQGVIHQYVPVDTPAAVRRFMAHWQPDLGVLVESELWPNLIEAARRRAMPLALISARITERSARGWQRFPHLARHLLSSLALVCPQDEASANRLRGLGARVGPQLNLKRIAAPPPDAPNERERLAAIIGDRPVVLAASTHPGDEDLILAALPPRPLLILAPRHPVRGPDLAGSLRQKGHSLAQRSAGEPLSATTDVYLADTLGEMGLFFALADITVMGGGFGPGIGGHNPLEPAWFSTAILTGPHAFNSAAVYGEMFAEMAALETTDLARDLKGLLDHPMVARRMGEAALTYVQRQGAALDQTLTLLSPLLPA